MNYLFTPPTTVTVPIVGNPKRFPVHRIYCLVRNYVGHAREMGFTGLEAPFFFIKPSDAESLVVVESNQPGIMKYPTLTNNLHHEVELVIAIGHGGKNIPQADADKYIYGYAVGLDMTRRDLQIDMAEKGRPWCIGKAFDHSAAIGAITPKEQISSIENAEIYLQVNGIDRQRCKVSELIWDASKIIEQISMAWTLCPGDLIYTGTPQGVAAVVCGDLMLAGVSGLQSLEVLVTRENI